LLGLGVFYLIVYYADAVMANDGLLILVLAVAAGYWILNH